MEDATKEVMRLGHNSVLAKVDIKNAYRIAPVHPDDHSLLEMQCCMSTPLAIWAMVSTKFLTAISDAAEWIVKQAGVRFIIHYLDDFLVIGASETDECERGCQDPVEFI